MHLETNRESSSDSAKLLSQPVDMEGDLVSIESLQDRIEDEKYAQYMRDGSIVLHDKALSITSHQKSKAEESASHLQQSVRIISFPSAGRSRSSQTIERIGLTVAADGGHSDRMQPVYITSLEEQHLITRVYSARKDPSSRKKAAAEVVVMTTEELPILEHDIFKKFQKSNEGKATPNVKRKMPASFSSLPMDPDPDPNIADQNSNSDLSVSTKSSLKERVTNSKKKKPKHSSKKRETDNEIRMFQYFINRAVFIIDEI